MPVISRSTSSVVLESGETASVFVENLAQAVNPSSFFVAGENSGLFRVARDNPYTGEVESTGWGVGTRMLFLTSTIQGAPSSLITPVIALLPDQETGAQPARGVFLESIVDPVIIYDTIRKKVTLFYYVNAWSPPPFSFVAGSPPAPPSPGPPPPPAPPPPPGPPPPPPPFGQYTPPYTLFGGVVPPASTKVDSDYYENPDYQWPQPNQREFTGVRDVPNWYTAADVSNDPMIDGPKIYDNPGSVYENVGPFDLTRFFVAPFTDAHLYRFPASLDGLSDPGKQPLPPVPPVPPPPPPPPPSPPISPSQDLLELFPFMINPITNLTQNTLAVLFKVKNQKQLTSLEYQTYNCYQFALARIMGLTRCTRVLMRAEGQFYNLQMKQDGATSPPPPAPSPPPPSPPPLPPPPGSPTTTTTTAAPVNKSPLYLVVEHPQPMMALPRGINKVLVGRPKLTTFIAGDVFITAALTYRYPAVGSVTLCGGCPQVDFTIHSPSDRFDENRRMGILPEALTPQHAPFDMQGAYTIPSGYGVSVIEVLSNMEQW